MIRIFLVSLWLVAALVSPATAQFADQATFAGTGAGSANAQTITLPNAAAYSDVKGVLIKYVPAATNTTAATLNINSFGSSPSFRRITSSGLAALVGGEITTGQTVAVMYDGTFFVIISSGNTTLSVTAASLANSSLQFGMPVNLQLNATVSANALTLAVKGNDGNNPSAANPVLVPFRDVTIANGDPTFVSIQAALSFTINSTSTMGCASGQMCRLWVVAINNAGTASLCAFNALNNSTLSIAPINEAALQTSASGTGGGSSSQTYYCNVSAVSAKAIRIIGYVDIQEVTAGTWATGPTYTQLFGPGIKKPGDVVQTVPSTTSTTQASSTTPGVANKVATALVASITPTSAANLVKVSSWGTMGTTDTNNGSGAVRLFRTTGTTAIGNISVCPGASVANINCTITNFALDQPLTTSTTQYGLYIYEVTGATAWTFLRSTDLGSNPASMILEEIMSALPPAANDNGLPLEMVG